MAPVRVPAPRRRHLRPCPQTLAGKPGWLQAIVRVNPVSHLVTAGRGPLSGHAAAHQAAWALIAAAIVTTVFAPLTGWLYGRP